MAAMVKAKREDTAIAAKSIQSSTVQQLPAVGRRVFQQQLTVGRINEDSSLGAWKLQHFTLHGLDLVEEEDVQQPRRVHVKAHTTSRLEAKRDSVQTSRTQQLSPSLIKVIHMKNEVREEEPSKHNRESWNVMLSKPRVQESSCIVMDDSREENGIVKGAHMKGIYVIFAGKEEEEKLAKGKAHGFRELAIKWRSMQERKIIRF
ncbi:hypothetical protein LR48_Vigan10g178200 [Vigna angularis]|uniref:Uncharacterized protein n=1 Tax=Phaseolus angularis TaxID=3914 RepID=A0A0L9VLG9_PHAAN|nr:hypothetical protein LR48_Vigan10g178200 [Vigna angularis]